MVSGCPAPHFLFHTQNPIQPLISFPNTNHHQHTHKFCVFPVYISFSKGAEHSHWSSLTFDQLFIWTTWYDTLITIITQCNTPVTIYVHDLDTFFLFGMCRGYWFAYH